MSMTQHEFALFSEDFSYAVKHKFTTVTLCEATLVHRLQHVLRLQKGETVILFDTAVHAHCTLQEYGKNKALLTFKEVIKNRPVLPEIYVILPLLKREALDEVIYACRELGVTRVFLVSTEKTSRHSLTASELERLERVSSAAAEQSKNFVPCHIQVSSLGKNLPSLSEVVKQLDLSPACKIFADTTGKYFTEMYPILLQSSPSFVLCVGPEGDLTDKEKMLLREHGFLFCQLGSTILRAQQAAVLLMGLIRVVTQK